MATWQMGGVKEMRTILRGITILTLLTMACSVEAVMGQSNIGMLRVNLLYPKQVAPSSTFRVSVDVEYGLYGANPTAIIRSAIYNGPINSTAPLWQSNIANVSYVGDQLWNTTLTSPATEGYLSLTAYAFYLEDGVWKFYNNTQNGPGFENVSIKVAKTSSLIIYVGAPGVSISVNGSNLTTSPAGDANANVPLNSIAHIAVPPTINLQNSTRSVFQNWNDANTHPRRDVTISGDTTLTANYTIQYLLKVNGPSSTETWYNQGSDVTLNAYPSIPMGWPLNAVGINGQFSGWSGDVQSSSTRVSLTMSGPKTVNMNYSVDYSLLALPIIFAVGITVLAASIILILLRRRAPQEPRAENAEATEKTAPPETPELVSEQEPVCPSCGKPVEKEWTHCIKCGAKLTNDSSSK